MIKFGSLSCLFLLLASCASVSVDEPFGDAPSEFDPEEWEGDWMTAEGKPVKIRVLDSKKVLIEAASVEDEDDVHQIEIREHGEDWAFAFIPADKEDSESGYVWGRVRNQKGQAIFFWAPHYEKFRDAIEGGKLKGETGKNSVMLKGLSENEIESFSSEGNQVFFQWASPGVLVRGREVP